MHKWIVIVISCLIFFGSVFFRYASYLDARDVPGRNTLAFQSWGFGTDQDYQLRCGIQYASGHVGNEALSHYDYFFMCSYFSVVFDYFSFIDSLEFFIFTNIIIGGVVAVAPFLTMWFLDKFTVGGLIASLIIMLSPVMIINTDGRFFIYPLVALFFTGYYITFLFSLKTRSLSWLTAFGSMAVLHGINKPFMYVNDIPLMVIFPIFFLIKKIRLIKTFPYLKIDFYDLKSNLPKAVAPSLIYFLGILLFELLHAKLTGGYFFLTDLFIDKGVSTKDAVLGASLGFEGSKYQQLVNIISLVFLAAKEWLDLILGGKFLFMLVVLVSLLKNRNPKVILGIGSLFILIMLSTDQLISNFLYPNIYVRVDDWFMVGNSLLGFFGAAWLFISLQSLFLFGVFLLHLFYFGGLAMSLQAVRQPQLYVTLVIWAAVMIGLATDHLLLPIIKNMTKRTLYTLLFLVCLMFFIPFHRRLEISVNNLNASAREKQYLTWVAQTLPEEGLVIGGADDNLIWLSRYIDKTIIYSGFAVASPIEPNQLASDLQYYPSYPKFIQENITSQSASNLFILDQNKPKWEQTLSSGAIETYPKDKYTLTVFAHHDQLERSIYMLTLRDENL